MNITVQYFDGCPNWKAVDGHLKSLLGDSGIEAEIIYQQIDTPELAAELQFRGSPTVLIDGHDPFADERQPVGLSCRIYQTEDGPAGSPSRDQLAQALTAAGWEGTDGGAS